MLDVDVIRMPVYPRTCFNSDYPYYSPEPFPVGTAPAMDAGAIAVSASDYISQVLKPAVDYATSKNLYVIVDYHQIDNVTGAHGSSADAVTFWTQIAPVFSGYPNVLYEAFNEPIDTTDGVTAGTWSTTFTTAAQSWVTAIRGGAPDNIIIVGSPSWSQYPNGSSGLTGGNLAFTAHLYPGNWPGAPTPAFQDRFTAAVALVPVFMTEWGYTTTGSATSNLYTPSDAWATSLQSYANANGASWTAWVADPSWGPPMFANPSATMLTDFGTFVQGWLKSP
jgi:aryl-phospho-beta-D-glucosidase BglC (GH1 family)